MQIESTKLSFVVSLKADHQWDLPSDCNCITVLHVKQSSEQSFFKVMARQGSSLLLIRADALISEFELLSSLLRLTDILKQLPADAKITYESIIRFFKTKDFQQIKGNPCYPPSSEFLNPRYLKEKISKAITENYNVRLFLILQQVTSILANQYMDHNSAKLLLKIILNFEKNKEAYADLGISTETLQILTICVKGKKIQGFLEELSICTPRQSVVPQENAHLLTSLKNSFIPIEQVRGIKESQYLPDYALENNEVKPLEEEMEKESKQINHTSNLPHVPLNVQTHEKSELNQSRSSFTSHSSTKEEDEDDQYHPVMKAVMENIKLAGKREGTKTINLNQLQQEFISILRHQLFSMKPSKLSQLELAKCVVGCSNVLHKLRMLTYISYTDSVFRLRDTLQTFKSCYKKKRNCKDNACPDHHRKPTDKTFQVFLIEEGHKAAINGQTIEAYTSLRYMLGYFYREANKATQTYVYDNLLQVYDFHRFDLNPDEFFNFMEDFFIHDRKDYLKYVIILENLFNKDLREVFSHLEELESEKKFEKARFIEDFAAQMGEFLISENRNHEFLKRFIRVLKEAASETQRKLTDSKAAEIIDGVIGWSVKYGGKELVAILLTVFSAAQALDYQVLKKHCLSRVLNHLKTESKQNFFSKTWSAFKGFFGNNKQQLPEEISKFFVENVVADYRNVFAELIEGRDGKMSFELLKFLGKFTDDKNLKLALPALKRNMSKLLHDIYAGNLEVELSLFTKIHRKIQGKLTELKKYLDDFEEPKKFSLHDSLIKLGSIADNHSQVTNQIRKLLALNKAPLEKVDPKEIKRKLASLEENDTKLISITEAHEFLSNNRSIVKISNLVDFEPLFSFLKKIIPSDQTQFSLSKAEGYCKQALGEVSDIVSKNRLEVNSADLDILTDIESSLQDDNIKKRIFEEKILDEADCNKLRPLILCCQLLNQGSSILNSQNEIEQMLRKKAMLEGNPSSKSQDFFEKLRQLTEKWNQSRKCKTDHLEIFIEKHRSEVEVLSGKNTLISRLGQIGDLYEAFKDKEAKHFDNMLFDKGEFTQLDTQDILGLQKLVEALRNKKFQDSLEYLTYCCRLLEGLDLAKLISKKEDLQTCSNSILKGDNNGQKIVEMLHSDNIIYFRYLQSLNRYTVVAVQANDHGDAANRVGIGLDDEGKLKTDSRLISHQKLKDTSIRVALIGLDAKNSEQGGFKAKIEFFARVMEQVESILQHLNYLMRKGEVFNINNFIKEQLENTISLESNNPFKDDKELKQLKKLFTCFDFVRNNDLSFFSNPGLLYADGSHLRMFRELLDSYITARSQSIFESMRQSHILSFWSGKQKLMICRSLISSTSLDPNLRSLCQSLLRFIVPTTKVIFHHQAMKQTTYTDQLLLNYFCQQKINLSVDYYSPPPLKNKRIKFVGYRSNHKYEDLFFLFASKSVKNLPPHRIFFVSYLTTFSDIEDFLMRAFCDPLNESYFLCDVHLLKQDVISSLMLSCNLHLDQNKDINLNCFFFLPYDDERRTVFNEFIKQCHMFEKELINSDTMTEKNKHLPQLSVNFVTSHMSGMGKSYLIQEEVKRAKLKKIDLLIGGDPSKESLEKRLEIIEREQDARQQCALHLRLDMMDNMVENMDIIDHLLFKLCYLKCIEYKDGYLFLTNISTVFIEIQNSYKDLILQRVCFFKLCEQREISPMNKNFMRKELILRELNMDKVELVCTFYRAVLDKSIGANSVMDLKKKLFPQEKRDSGDLLIETLHDLMFKGIESQRKNENDASIQMLSFLIKVLSYQVEQMERVPGLNPSTYDSEAGSATYVTFMNNLTKSRLTTSRNILELTLSLVWSTSRQLRDEKKLGNEVQRRNQNTDFALLEDYAKKVKSMPKWEYTDQLSIFFNGDAMKILYKDCHKVTTDIQSLIKNQTGKEVQDYSTMKPSDRQNKLIRELAEALNLFVSTILEPTQVLPKPKPVPLNEVAMQIEEFRGNYMRQLTPRGIIAQKPQLFGERKSLIVQPSMIGKVSPPSPRQPTIEPKFSGQPEDQFSREAIILKNLKKKMASFNQKGYVITHDNYLKILMIYQRAVLGIPIVIMGATGCGKTYLIDFISSCLLGETFQLFSMHSGVTENDLEKQLLTAYNKATNSNNRVWLLFDEFNTSSLQCLVSDIMLSRKCCFSYPSSKIVFPDNLVFVAACNPYRLTSQSTSVGLQHDKAGSMILAHRVYPIPDALISSIWDFGQLTSSDEEEYIMIILDSPHTKITDAKQKEELCNVMVVCQRYLRRKCSDNSVSLRDVKRVVILYNFFLQQYKCSDEALCLTAYLCYFSRLVDNTTKQELNGQINRKYSISLDFQRVFEQKAREYSEQLREIGIIPENISLNVPLTENLMAVTTCVLNKLPIIICGKPGTSKTLAINICQKALHLHPEQKANITLITNTPRVYTIPIWGSATMTSATILQTFATAEIRREEITILAKSSGQSKDQFPIVCVVFDEIGLAEIAPENPLKVLHSLLDPQEPKVSFIGLSNWILDQSKMNRVVFVSRPDMTVKDLMDTCQMDIQENKLFSRAYKNILKKRLDSLSGVYHRFRDQEQKTYEGNHPNFHGSRDFYETVKIFKKNLILVLEAKDSQLYSLEEEEITDAILLNSLQRNFSGKVMSRNKLSHQVIIDLMAQSLPDSKVFQNKEAISNLKTIDLVYQNLLDKEARHLMILCSSSTVEEFLVREIRNFEVDVKKRDPSKIVSLYHSKGNEEMVRVVMTKLPLYIKHGYTLIMKDLDEVYGCMYDVLNRNYSRSSTENNRECELHFENNKTTVQVHQDFKCIILMHSGDSTVGIEEMETKQQPPFLNRFEKYLIREEDFIEPEKKQLYAKLQKKYLKSEGCKLYAKPAALFHNLSRELLYSAVVKDSSSIRERLKYVQKDNEDSSQRYINYLEQVILILNDNQKKKAPKHHQEVNIKEWDQEDKFESEVTQKLITIASRNLIIQNTIFPLTYDMPDTFKEDFLRTHPYDKFTDFFDDFLNKDGRQNRGILFTYSSVWELKHLVQNPKVRLLEASDFFGKDARDDVSIHSELSSSSIHALVVQFTRRSEWSMCQQIRMEVDSILKHQKVLFVAHYHKDDILFNQKEETAINFLTTDWKMIVIDDLNGCNYPATFDLMNKKCSSLLKVPLSLRNRAKDLQSLSLEVVAEALKQFIIESSEDYKDVSRGNILMQFIIHNTESTKIMADKLEKKSQLDLTVADMLARDDLGFIFNTFIDSADHINFRIRKQFLDEAKKIWKRFKAIYPFKVLLLACLLDPESCKGIGYKLTQTLNDPERSNIFTIIKNKKIEVNKLEEQIAVCLNTFQRFKREGKWTKGISAFKGFVQRQSTWTFTFPEYDAQLIDDIHMSQLQALIYLEKYLDHKVPEFCENLIITTILQVALKYEQISGGGLVQDSRHFAALMIIIAEIFKEDLLVLCECGSFEPVGRHREIAKELAEMFTKEGKIDFTPYIERLASIRVIENPKEIEGIRQRVKQVRKLQMKLAGRLKNEHPQFSNESCHMVEACLFCIEQIKSSQERDQLIKIFNASVQQSQIYEDIVVRFLSGVMTQESLFRRSTVLELAIARLFQSIMRFLVDLVCQSDVSDDRIIQIADVFLLFAISFEDLRALTCASLVKVLTRKEDSTKTRAQHFLVASLNKSIQKENCRRTVCDMINHYLVLEELSKFDSMQTRISQEDVKDCIIAIRELVTNSTILPILNVSQTRVIVKLVSLFSDVKRDSAVLRKNNTGVFLDNMISVMVKKVESIPLALLLMRMIFPIAPLESRLANELGLVKMAQIIVDWSRDLDNEFVIPEQTEFEKIKDLRKNIQLASDPTMKILNTFYQRTDLVNLFLMPEVNPGVKERIMPLLSNTPSYQEFFNVVTAHLSASAVKDNIYLYMILAMAINISESCESFAYSTAKLKTPAFSPMLNYPSENVNKYLPLVQFKQLRTTDFTKLWECTNPGCGALIPVGDCGQIGHLGDNFAKSICLKCKKPIGQLGTNQPNMRPHALDIGNLVANMNNWLANDETPLRLEPRTESNERRFEDEWILMKYHTDISNRSVAMIVHLVQSLFLYLHSQLQGNPPRGFQVPLREEDQLGHLLMRDFRLLSSQFEKDQHSMFIFMCILLCNLHHEISTKNNCQTPAQFRKVLANSCQSMTSKVNEVLGNYQQKKTALMMQKTTENQIYLGFIKGNLTRKILLESFSKTVVSLSQLLRYHEPITPTAILFKLNEGSNRNESQIFLDVVINRRRLLEGALKTIMMSVRQFGLFLSKRLDCKMTSEEAINCTIKHLINKEFVLSIHKRNYHKKTGDDLWADKVEDDYQQESKDEILEKEFKNFSENWQASLAIIKQDAEDLLKLKFECQQLPAMFKKLESLSNPNNSILCYLVSESKAKDLDSTLMQSFLESLIKFQSDIFVKYGGLADIDNKAVHRSSFYRCSTDAFFKLDHIEETIHRHSYLAFQENEKEEIHIDSKYLANKFASELLANYSDLNIEPILCFLDSDSKDISRMISSLFTKLKFDPKTAKPLKVSLSEYADSIRSLENWIKILVSKILQSADIKSELLNNRLSDFVEDNEREFAHPLLERITVSQLELVRNNLLLANYSTLAKKVTKERQGLETKNLFPDLKNIGENIKKEDLQSCSDQLKILYCEQLGHIDETDNAKFKENLKSILEAVDLKTASDLLREVLKPGFEEAKLVDIPKIIEFMIRISEKDDN